MYHADLPIHAALPALKAALSSCTSAVIQAPPGAGKTTVVPLELLDEPWLAGGKILMLEPRRLAARAAAYRMADSLGQSVGETVGYRVRLDSSVGPRTRIEVVTEGILTRRLQHDQALEGVGLVIFDEFHERSIHADLGLALALDVQQVLRPDLRLLVMSATLDGERVAALMDNAPIASSEGRLFAVATTYLPRKSAARIEEVVLSQIHRVIRDESGSVLAFLPGAGEIARVHEELRRSVTDPHIIIAPLHGSLARDEQDRAIMPAPGGMRKIVLATSIAETSLTIDGVRIVIDSGLMRVPRFDPRSGMGRLETLRVTKASADQRRGRAGRTEPGICHRMWTEADNAMLEPFALPEILCTDLAPLALELAAWGVGDTSSLRWLDPPPAGAFAQARELLHELGALDAHGTITPHGRRISELSLHPRLAHMVLKAKAIGRSGIACDMAALLEERDIVRQDRDAGECDLRIRLDALHQGARAVSRSDMSIDRAACDRARQAAVALRKQLHVRAEHEHIDDAGLILAFAYPDRIGKRRADSQTHFLLSNDRGAHFTRVTPLSMNDYIAVADLDDREGNARIFLAAPLDERDLLKQFADVIATDEFVAWDPRRRAVAARRQTRIEKLVISDEQLREPPRDKVIAALIDGIRQEGIAMLPWDDEARTWQARVMFLRSLDAGNWPDVSDERLLATLEDWLAPHLGGITSRAQLQKLDLCSALSGMLSWQQRKELEHLAPTHIKVPTGSHIRLDYAGGPVPILPVRVQEMFGATETPRVAGGRVPVVIHLLSPAYRPVQVTQDLAGFWRTSYELVKKDLKGRYPKHYWPDDPLHAEPTRRVKRAR
ncbi:ATP-dependent helicase HrpB, partial [bacterium]|nr:ATP-dependent helicase HrpB [bacterium]